MRRRVVKEVLTIAGIAAVLGGLVFANSELRRGSLAERMDAMRSHVEAAREAQGLELLRWDVVRETRGGRSAGPTFSQGLLEHRDTRVDIVGFMAPIYEFRDVTEFLLLPLPIECYFCQEPPMRDVVLVRMREGERATLVNEPVLVNGELILNEGPGTDFFYIIDDAMWGPGEEGVRLTRQDVDPQHRLHEQLEQFEEELLEGIEVEE